MGGCCAVGCGSFIFVCGSIGLFYEKVASPMRVYFQLRKEWWHVVNFSIIIDSCDLRSVLFSAAWEAPKAGHSRFAYGWAWEAKARFKKTQKLRTSSLVPPSTEQTAFSTDKPDYVSKIRERSLNCFRNFWKFQMFLNKIFPQNWHISRFCPFLLN